MSKVVSLQTKLIKTSLLTSMVTGVLALLLFTVISFYQTMQIQDQLMEEIADMLLISDLTNSSGQQVDELSDEFDIQYQLKSQQQVLTQSKDFYVEPDVSIQENQLQEGYHFIWQEHQLWRSYNILDSELEMSVNLLQPMGDRFKDLAQNLMGYGFILVLLWLVQWIILHFAVKRQFKIIHQLSKEIAEKNANDLAPIQQPEPLLKELQPMMWQLNQLLQRLQQSLIAEQRFTADASHELRSPLSAIQMRLQVLKRKHPELNQELLSIQNDVSRGTQVLENLLLLARLDPTDIHQLPKSKLNIDTVIADVIQALQPFAAQRKIQISTQIDSTLSLMGNQELIFSCLRNLIDNAIRYSRLEGSIYIDVRQKDQYVLIQIENEGEGVTQETLSRLGERFYRVLGTKVQGSGLGLSICKKIIELHLARIKFASSAYGGLKVTLEFPMNVQQ